MAFLAINSQRSLYNMQKTQLEFEKTIIVSRCTALQRQMGYLAEQAPEDYAETPQYKQLEQMEMYYTTRQEALENQIQFLNEAMNSFKTLANNNMKSSATINLGSGG